MFVSPEDERYNVAGGDAAGSDDGVREYLVLDPNGIGVRVLPFDETPTPRGWGGKPKGPCVPEGHVVQVVERRCCDSAASASLKLADGRGWIPDCRGEQPEDGTGSAAPARIAEATLEEGEWIYGVTSEHAMQLRPLASFAEVPKKNKIPPGPGKGEVVAVYRRIRVGDSTFLQLGEDYGGGWILDSPEFGLRTISGPLHMSPTLAALIGNRSFGQDRDEENGEERLISPRGESHSPGSRASSSPEGRRKSFSGRKSFFLKGDEIKAVLQNSGRKSFFQDGKGLATSLRGKLQNQSL